jgi:hypothetical protein
VLLLALGITLPQAGGLAPQVGQPVAMSQPMALRGEEPLQLVLGGVQTGDAEKGFFRSSDVREITQRVERVDELGARINASVQNLEKLGKKHQAESLARQYASNLTRIAMYDRQKGDLARAELAYNEACNLCARTLGPDAPETIRTRNSLADVYEVALNTVNLSGQAPGAGGASNPYFAMSELDVRAGAKNGGYLTTRNAPPTDQVRGKHVASMKMLPAPAASPRGLTPPVRTASAYEPPAPAVPQPRVESAPGKRVYAPHPAVPPAQARQQAAVVLYDRIISQRQTELKNSVVPVLMQALREAKNSAERQRFALALGRLGPAARDSVEGLLECYRQATAPSERATILLSLGEIGPSAQQALPVLVASLQSDSAEVRNCAARALVQFGPAARPSVQKLILERPDNRWLHDVLVRIDGPEGRCGIDDECGCFSVKAIQQTRQEIHQLATAFRLEIRVETSHEPVRLVAKESENLPHTREIWLYDRVPSPTTLHAENKKGKRELGEYGVYVHINKDTPDVQVYVSDALQAQGLTDKRLRQVLEPHLRNKEFDRGLREGVHFLARFEKEHAK